MNLLDYRSRLTRRQRGELPAVAPGADLSMSELQVLAQMFMPHPSFFRTGEPEDDASFIPPQDDPLQPRRNVWPPVFHVRRENFLRDWESTVADPVHADWLDAAGPLLQTAADTNLAMELYMLGLGTENAWFALQGMLHSQGRLGYEARGFDSNLTALLDALDGVPVARLVAFVWRQRVVDRLLQFLSLNRPRRPGTTLPGSDSEFEMQCLYDIFCWMRSQTDRDTLDAVLGTVELERTSGQVVDRDLRSGLLGTLFAQRGVELGALFGGFRTRWRRLPVQDRCVTWPRFVALMKRTCSWSEAFEERDPPEGEGPFPFEPEIPDDDGFGPIWEDGKPPSWTDLHNGFPW